MPEESEGGIAVVPTPGAEWNHAKAGTEGTGTAGHVIRVEGKDG